MYVHTQIFSVLALPSPDFSEIRLEEVKLAEHPVERVMSIGGFLSLAGPRLCRHQLVQ